MFTWRAPNNNEKADSRRAREETRVTEQVVALNLSTVH